MASISIGPGSIVSDVITQANPGDIVLLGPTSWNQIIIESVDKDITLECIPEVYVSGITLQGCTGITLRKFYITEDVVIEGCDSITFVDTTFDCQVIMDNEDTVIFENCEGYPK